MIKVANLSKSYGPQVVFTDISFNINQGEKIGLVGRNGEGKSTLVQILAGKVAYDAGELVIPNDYEIGYLSQHINFTASSVLDEACLGLPEIYKHDIWRAEKILAGLGFTKQDQAKSPQELSGGWQVRLQLAQLLLSEPDLLLLDEPTNYLDIVAVAWLKSFLQEWRGEIILITHDRHFMDAVCTHILGLHRKKIKKVTGDTQRYYDFVYNEDDVYEKTRRRQAHKQKEVETFVNKFRAKARQGGLAQSRLKMLAKLPSMDKLEKLHKLEFSFPAAKIHTRNIGRVYNISYRYEPDTPLIEKVSITLLKKDRIGIIGANGKGKTTLLRMLAGQIKPQTGSIRYAHNLQIGYFGQANVQQLDPDKTIIGELLSSSEGYREEQIRALAGNLLFIGDAAKKQISVLSGGEKSRVSLGKLLLQPTHLLLLDEPTNHFDMESSQALMDALNRYDGTIVFVTHNEDLLYRIATRLIVMGPDGPWVFEGSYEQFMREYGWESMHKDELDPAVTRKAVMTQAKKAERKAWQERLKKINRQLENIEKEIFVLEEKKVGLEVKMVKAVEKQKQKQIEYLGRALKETQVSIDELQTAWDYSAEQLAIIKTEEPQ